MDDKKYTVQELFDMHCIPTWTELEVWHTEQHKNTYRPHVGDLLELKDGKYAKVIKIIHSYDGGILRLHVEQNNEFGAPIKLYVFCSEIKNIFDVRTGVPILMRSY